MENEQTRKQFEEWALGKLPLAHWSPEISIDLGGDYYKSDETAAAFDAWQAATDRAEAAHALITDSYAGLLAEKQRRIDNVRLWSEAVTK